MGLRFVLLAVLAVAAFAGAAVIAIAPSWSIDVVSTASALRTV